MKSEKNLGHILLSLASYKDGNEVFRSSLNKKKLLIGRFENADICINDPTVSHYHALIIMDGQDGGTLKDLASENGIYVNDQKGEELYFSLGDSIRIGGVDFYIEETVGQNSLINNDQEIVRVHSDELNYQKELPPVSGFELIDGEYCDIVFDDKQFSPDKINHPLLNQVDLGPKNYIDVEEPKSIRENFILQSKQQAIEVSFLSSGNILSIYYLPLRNRKYDASGLKKKSRNCLLLDGMLTDKKIPFIDIKNGEVKVHNLAPYFVDDLGSQEHHEWISLINDDILTYTFGTLQLFIRITDNPAKHRKLPFFTADKEIIKPLLYAFVPVVLLATLLLFIDTTPPPEAPKPVAVIYRKAVEANQFANDKSKEIADQIDTQSGIKEKNQAEKPPQFSASSSSSTKKSDPTPKQAVANEANKPAKVKPYQFKSDKLANLFANKAGAPNLQANESTSEIAKTSLAASAGDVSTKNIKSIGTLGSDSYGSESQSYGAQGLSSKKGVNTAYVAPKTVILGSMDPELLRKILREYLPQFKHCYQQELDLHSDDIKGVVNLDFRIGADGRVTTSKVEGSKAKFSSQGEECMRNVLSRIAFPRPKGGGVVDVRQPLNFFSERTKM